MSLQIIEGNALAKMCDYSFGDHLFAIDPINLPDSTFKIANESNTEFLEKCKEFEGRVMTLFIDNIRLYNRELTVKVNDVYWVLHLLATNNLLKLCAELDKNKFVIFTSHEDTPIDENIFVPDNVLGIHAVNAVYNNEKIHPFPIGLQRQLGPNDTRLQTMKAMVKRDLPQVPTKLLYINCGLGSERNEGERAYLPEFQRFEWATCRFDKNSKFFPYERYYDFLLEIKDHKFMVCPKGHGMDCHRNWESLYLRRVPVMLDHPYFRTLMEGFPVLFIDDWSEITPKLLVDNNHLYEQAQKMSLRKLDLSTVFSGIMKSYIVN